MPEMTGAAALMGSLAHEGVEIIFGLPGEQIMEMLDAVYQQKGLRWVSVRHEQTAAYMAFGYARTTGKVGVALVVPGPGALNTAAAIGTAYATSTPVLLLAGQVETYNLGKQRGATHEVAGQMDVFKPITKWCHCVHRVEEIPWAVRKAMHELKSGRQRPVELEFPRDVMQNSGKVNDIEVTESISPRSPELSHIKEAARLLSEAKKPVIWAGGGIISSDASRELTLVAERLNAPVITTPEGKGAIPGNHPLSLGVFYSGYGPAHLTLPQADVILVVGSRFYFSARAPMSFREDQKLIQIDVDSAEIGRNNTIHLGIESDARIALKLLLEALTKKSRSNWQAEELDKIKYEVKARLEKVAPLQLSLIRTIREELDEYDILVPGVTNIAYWGHLSYPVLQPRSYLNSSYFATLGYAFPTALGAKVGNPNKRVVAICGDGGFAYGLGDLATAVQEKVNIVAIVFVDNAFGASLRDQHLRFESRIIGTQLHNPDFANIANVFGARGLKLESPEELRGALRTAFDGNMPTVIEVPVPTMVTPFW